MATSRTIWRIVAMAGNVETTGGGGEVRGAVGIKKSPRDTAASTDLPGAPRGAETIDLLGAGSVPREERLLESHWSTGKAPLLDETNPGSITIATGYRCHRLPLRGSITVGTRVSLL
ncbi:unnamed protein product [Lampetra planeri]